MCAAKSLNVDSKRLFPTFSLVSAEESALLAQLHAQCFEKTWDENIIRTMLDSSSVVALAAKRQEEIYAMIIASVVADEAEILTLGVHPQARMQGVASALLEALHAYCRQQNVLRVHLEVAEDNASALKLYRNAAYVLQGRRKAYYSRQDGSLVDALTYCRMI